MSNGKGETLDSQEVSAQIRNALKAKEPALPEKLRGLAPAETGIPLDSELSVSWRGKVLAAGEALDLRAENRSGRTLNFRLVNGMTLVPEDEKSQQMG